MEKESSGQRPVEANSTGGQGSRRAVAPSDDILFIHVITIQILLSRTYNCIHADIFKNLNTTTLDIFICTGLQESEKNHLQQYEDTEICNM
jgi:hypothetical protein